METTSIFQEGKTPHIKRSLQALLIHDQLEQV